MQYRRPVLPLNALRAFDAVMRLGGMARAAGELGVTPGAVSRQIRALQMRLGVILFEGPRNGRTPTTEADRLWAEIAPAFVALEATMAQRSVSSRRVTVSCMSTLAARWLIPRLAAFAAAEPSIQIELKESYTAIDRGLDGCDLAIRMMTPDRTPPRGIDATPFMINPVGMVVAPDRAEASVRRLVSRSHPEAWTAWTRTTGFVPADTPPLTFDHQQTMIEAALAGLGAAVTQRPLVEAELAAGRLVAPLGFIDDGARFVVFRRSDATGQPVRCVIDWLLREGAASAGP